MSEAAEPSIGARITLDLKIPLWGMVTAGSAGLFMAIALYFNVQALTEAVKDLQIAVKSGNSSITSVVGQVQLIDLRTSNNETDIKRHSEEIRILQKASR